MTDRLYYVQDEFDVPEELTRKAELTVEKQRNGPTGVVETRFRPNVLRYDAASRSWVDDESERLRGAGDGDETLGEEWTDDAGAPF